MDSSLAAGVQLMIAGMGTVFVFLTLLVFATRLVSMLVQRFVPEPVAVAAPAAPRPAATAQPDADELAAIAEAIARFRAGQ